MRDYEHFGYSASGVWLYVSVVFFLKTHFGIIMSTCDCCYYCHSKTVKANSENYSVLRVKQVVVYTLQLLAIYMHFILFDI